MRLIVVNLSLLILLGVAASGWVLYYTEWFPLVGGLLGLGGLFAWVAFVSGLLTGERKEQFQQGFDRAVLLERRTWRVVVLVGAVFFLWASAHGSIVFRSLADDRDRLVEIRRAGADGDPAVHFLPPRAEQKHLVFTGWWGRPYRVKVSGLPAAEVEVSPFRRRIVAVPSSFTERSVVLIRPTLRISGNAGKMPFELIVWRGGKVIGRLPSGEYRGETVWVGCDSDVEVPDRLLDLWRLELFAAKVPEEAMVRWAAPLAIAEETAFKPGDSIRAELRRKDGGVYAVGEVKIEPFSPGRGFVQVLPLEIFARQVPVEEEEGDAHAENPSS